MKQEEADTKNTRNPRNKTHLLGGINSTLTTKRKLILESVLRKSLRTQHGEKTQHPVSRSARTRECNEFGAILTNINAANFQEFKVCTL